MINDVIQKQPQDEPEVYSMYYNKEDPGTGERPQSIDPDREESKQGEADKPEKLEEPEVREDWAEGKEGTF